MAQPQLVDPHDPVMTGENSFVRLSNDNGNTILMSAAQMCGPKIVGKLIAAGADVNAASSTGITPLAMALLMHHPDAAEVLVARGARLNASQVEMLSAAVTDPREKAILERASGR
jgi:ankyrin repeat protein